MYLKSFSRGRNSLKQPAFRRCWGR